MLIVKNTFLDYGSKAGALVRSRSAPSLGRMDISLSQDMQCVQPEIRLSMHNIVYQNVVYFNCRYIINELWRKDIFRKGAQNDFEVWVSNQDMISPTLKTLVNNARTLHAMHASNLFGISLDAQNLVRFYFDNSTTVKSICDFAFLHHRTTNVQIWYLGKEISHGLLVDHGVGPGSILECLAIVPCTDIIKEIQLHLDKNCVKQAAAMIFDSVWILACHEQGCRLIQSVIRSVDLCILKRILLEFHGNVHQACYCCNANYVLQCVIETSPSYCITFISEEIAPFVNKLVRHRYGCRIILRLIENGSGGGLPNAIAADAQNIIRHRYGHHAANGLLEHGTLEQKQAVLIALGSQNLRTAVESACNKNAYYVHLRALTSSAHVISDLKHVLVAGALALAFDALGSKVLIATMHDEQTKMCIKNYLVPRIEDLRRSRYGRRVLNACVQKKCCPDFANPNNSIFNCCEIR